MSFVSTTSITTLRAREGVGRVSLTSKEEALQRFCLLLTPA